MKPRRGVLLIARAASQVFLRFLFFGGAGRGLGRNSAQVRRRRKTKKQMVGWAGQSINRPTLRVLNPTLTVKWRRAKLISGQPVKLPGGSGGHSHLGRGASYGQRATVSRTGGGKPRQERRNGLGPGVAGIAG